MNTLIMCAMTAARNRSDAQWWICLISSPPRTSKLMSSVEANAWLIRTPRSGT
jgi:hypothetical protein